MTAAKAQHFTCMTSHVHLARNRPFAAAFAAVCAFACATAQAQETGFFSGLRFAPTSGAPVGSLSFTPPGLRLGQALEFSRPADSANPLPTMATAFGGYQFGSGLAFGAALNSSTSSSPFAATTGASERDGVGLRFDAARWTVPAPTSNVNVDVVSAFNYRNSLSVYGKVGVGRIDARAGEVSFVPGQAERTSLTYGVGVRYDFSPNMGLKFELSRGTKFGFGSSLKTYEEPDSLNLGIRWSF
jgi:opacity protein-like surface antigen